MEQSFSKIKNKSIVTRSTPVIDWAEVKLTKREFEVLRHIASKGPRIEYKLQGELRNMSHGTLSGVLKRLNEKKKVLMPFPKGKARTGKTIKEYRLTALGVASLFASSCPDTPKDMLKFVERWKDVLPLVFGKWSLFVDTKVTKVATRRLIIASDETLRGCMIPPHERYSVETFDTKKAFTHNFYHPILHVGDESERRMWVAALGRDPALSTYMAEFLNLMEYVHEATIKDLRHIWRDLYASWPLEAS
jgi:DNA-binding HxlR family transcriptional regulator